MRPQCANMDQRSVEDEFASLVASLTTAHESNETCPTDEEVRNATDTFRWLRNNAPRLQESAKRELLESGCVRTCRWFFDHYFVNEPLSRSVVLQFLANFSVNHQLAQQIIFKVFNDTLRYVSITFLVIFDVS